jgi:hypothetical protein
LVQGHTDLRHARTVISPFGATTIQVNGFERNCGWGIEYTEFVHRLFNKGLQRKNANSWPPPSTSTIPKKA